MPRGFFVSNQKEFIQGKGQCALVTDLQTVAVALIYLTTCPEEVGEKPHAISHTATHTRELPFQKANMYRAN